MRPRFSQVDADYFPLNGGLDLVTPAISMPPGKLISCQNYEPAIGGGYSRKKGYERFSGKALPSSKGYWIATVSLSAIVAVGDTITGVTSAVTGVVIFIHDATTLVLAVVSGTFVAETIQVSAVDVGTVSTVFADAADMPSDHADYKNLAADNWRPQIATVTGSGDMRGIWYYEGSWYAFRDNAGATAGDMWKATSGGWTQVAFGSEIQFTGAVGEIFVYSGTPIAGLASGATARVVKPMLRTGTWTVAGAGTLIISNITGTWQSGEAIQVSGVTKATSASLATPITRAAGGQLEFVNANFTGSTATKKMYGVDGVNKAFEFDGTNYIPIRTGMTADAPTRVIAHKNFLFLSFLGSVQYSAIGAPYSWTVVLGAGEIATGEYVTGFSIQSGDTTSASLAIFTSARTFMLYGTPGTASLTLVPTTDDIGALAFTAQSIGNDTLTLGARGIQRLLTTLKFGNFEFASISHLIQPTITTLQGLQICSTTIRDKNQYRVFFTDGTCLVVGLTGDRVSGITVLAYEDPPLCICTAQMTDGTEVTMFGSDTGYIYQDDSGTSFDGEPIEHWIRLPFNTLKSPRLRKRYRAAVLEIKCDGYMQFNVTYDLGYGTYDVEQGVGATAREVVAAGGYWDQFVWDEFTFDSQAIANPRIALDGIEKNISLLFYGSRDQDDPFTIQGVTMLTSKTRQER